MGKTTDLFREGDGMPLQYSCLENPMDGGAWWAAVHGVTKSQTWLSNFTFTFYFHALEKGMATHSSVLGWRIPEPGGLRSMGSHRIGHDWSNLAAAAAAQTSSKKIRDTKGIFHAKKGSIKDRNSMDLTETEEIKKNTWKNYTKKVLMTRITTMVWSLS